MDVQRHKRLTLFSIIAALLILGSCLSLSPQIDIIRAYHPVSDQTSRLDEITPAVALANGQPSLFYITPAEVCQIRACPSTAEIAGRLPARFRDRLNFVPVSMHAVQPGVSAEPYAHLGYSDWNLYPTAPQPDWLPAPKLTPFGLGLEAPVVLLVDSQGRLVYRTGEDFSPAELEPYLQNILAK
jgi:hypothetical protein